MLSRSRQPYIKTQSPEKIQPTVVENSKTEDVNSMLVDTLKILSKNIESNKQTLALLAEKFEYLEVRQQKLEEQIGRYNAMSNLTDSDLSNIRNELKLLKRDKEKEKEIVKPNISVNNLEAPIMQGTGFASITPGYLRSLQNR
jgi:hypothetical protein